MMFVVAQREREREIIAKTEEEKNNRLGRDVSLLGISLLKRHQSDSDWSGHESQQQWQQQQQRQQQQWQAETSLNSSKVVTGPFDRQEADFNINKWVEVFLLLNTYLSDALEKSSLLG